MLAFDIDIDGEPAVIAGVDDWPILALHVDGVRERSSPSPRDFEVRFAVGALTMPNESGTSQHVRWQGRQLGLGSVVTIKVIETAEPDPPAKRYRSDREVEESPYTEEELRQMRYDDYVALKAEFEPES